LPPSPERAAPLAGEPFQVRKRLRERETTVVGIETGSEEHEETA
jgi:hypothetical protein